MKIISEFDQTTKKLVINLGGELEHHDFETFKSTYERFQPQDVSSYEINMHAVSYINSLTLGMFLMMGSFINDNSKIIISNCTSDVLRIFQISNFNKLFKFAP